MKKKKFSVGTFLLARVLHRKLDLFKSGLRRIFLHLLDLTRIFLSASGHYFLSKDSQYDIYSDNPDKAYKPCSPLMLN